MPEKYAVPEKGIAYFTLRKKSLSQHEFKLVV